MADSIFIIDDSPIELKLLKAILAVEGYQVYPFNNGELALSSMRVNPPDLILLDVRMPFMDGIEVCRRVNDDEQLRDIPVIFISGATDTDDKVRGFKSGAVDYITKPFQREEVIARVQTQVTLHRSKRQLKQAEIALRKSEQNLMIAQAVAHLGHCKMDLHNGEITCSDEAYRIFGLDPGTFPPSCGAFLETVHPEDGECFVRCMEHARSGTNFETEFRVVLPDGSTRVVRSKQVHAPLVGGGRDSEVTGIQSSATEVIVVFQDITEHKDAKARLAASESRLRTIIETEPECIKVIDARGHLLQMNPAGLAMIEADSFEQVADQSMVGLISPAYQKAYAKLHARVIAGEPQKMEFEVIGLKGGRRWMETNAVPMSDGDEIVHLSVSRDITQRKQAETSLKLAASVFANSYEGIVVTDADNVIIDVNPAFTRITGYEKEEIIGKNPKILASGRQKSAFYAAMWKSLLECDTWHGEVWNRRKNGEVYAEMLSISAVRDEMGKLLHYIGVFSDITYLKQHEAELHHVANYDSLTGVPNRRLLSDRLGQAIARARRSGKILAVCYLDLDGFKPINDRFGHAVGDRLLIEVTGRLLNVLRQEDTLGRLGGDEFVLLLNDLSLPEDSHVVLERILGAIRAPVQLDGKEICVSASIGITLFPPDSPDADSLLRHADQAMYHAKEIGKNRYHLFNPEQDRQSQTRRNHQQRLGEALQKGEFVLHYQPRVDLISGEVVGAEALIRWQHPEEGLLHPGAFLRYVEGSDLEIAMGNWVIESALQQMDVWLAEGLDFVVSVNVTANHLSRPGFTEFLRLALERHPNISPASLELEILETADLGDMIQAIDILSGCRKLGVRFALDDFGTGYSSLVYFRKLPVDILKIDQGFVQNMLDDPNDLGIVEAVVRIANVFNRQVVAEGVETMDHGALLVNIGCRFCQGYGISRPMPAKQLIPWMRQWSERAIWTSITLETGAGMDFQLVAAANSHKRWVERLVECVENNAPEKMVDFGSKGCRFGRWHRTGGTMRYGNLPVFQTIAPIHEQIHALGAELLEQSSKGRAEAAKLRLPEIHALQDKFLGLLGELSAELEEQTERNS